jgi:hypothetical protein
MVATKIAFGTSPAPVEVRDEVWTPFTVEVQDGGSALIVDEDLDITVSLNTGTGALSGTLTVRSINGVATFDNVFYDNLDEDITIDVAASGLTGITAEAVVMADEFWISEENGDDSNDGKSRATPWKNLTQLASVTPSTSKRATKFRYEYGSLWVGQTLNAPILWASDLDHMIVHEPYGDPAKGRPWIDRNDLAGAGINATETRYNKFKGFRITNCNNGVFVAAIGTGSGGSGIAHGNVTEDCIIDTCTLDGTNYGLNTELNTVNCRVTNCIISNCGNDGASQFGETELEIDNCNIGFVGVNIPGTGPGDCITSHGGAGMSFHDNILHDCDDGIHSIHNSASNRSSGS